MRVNVHSQRWSMTGSCTVFTRMWIQRWSDGTLRWRREWCPGWGNLICPRESPSPPTSRLKRMTVRRYAETCSTHWLFLISLIDIALMELYNWSSYPKITCLQKIQSSYKVKLAIFSSSLSTISCQYPDKAVDTVARSSKTHKSINLSKYVFYCF